MRFMRLRLGLLLASLTLGAAPFAAEVSAPSGGADASGGC